MGKQVEQPANGNTVRYILRCAPYVRGRDKHGDVVRLEWARYAVPLGNASSMLPAMKDVHACYSLPCYLIFSRMTCGWPDRERTLLRAPQTLTLGPLSPIRAQLTLLWGNSTRACLKSGLWSESASTCRLVTCAKPTLPADGYVTAYSFDVRADVIYHCNEGYRLETGHDGSPQPSSGHGRTRSIVGQQIRVCQEDSQWSGEALLCQEIRCGPPSEKHGGAKVLGISGSDRHLTSTFARRREHLAMEDSYR
ncbi:hypothetical protein O3P69_014545 [Scylla paramamosain]|uniref:Sushi domain-containing protein n=1 Tax=Scylla paramamosain TaxID=85552 RepID=A0AAW0SE91_SCYPA